MNKEIKLSVNDLKISFRTDAGKVQAVRNISFDLYKGETLAIVGESGSGKSVTSKAIMGISAGNSIYEGGEILYDGQDLTRIPEEEMHKLRGDKIAMIFQDPLSSLNPIMRIGKQLTEAMVLKGKARQRNSKENFYGKLTLLEKYMIESHPEKVADAKKQCEIFRQFEMKHIELEQAYNEAHEAAEVMLADVEHMLFLIDKKALKEPGTQLENMKEMLVKAVNPFVVAEDRAAEFKADVKNMTVGLGAQQKSGNFEKLQGHLENIVSVLKEALAKDKPNFFALGYYRFATKDPAPMGTVEENNQFYRRYLDDHFMLNFIEMGEKALSLADEKYLALREEAVKQLKEALPTLEAKPVQEDQLKNLAVSLGKVVNASINPLDVIKDSAACTFAGSLQSFVNRYFLGKRTNGRKIRKYEKELAKHTKLVQKGKNPDWQVAAASVIDLDQVQENIVRLVNNLIAHYEQRNAAANQEDVHEKTVALIDYLKENASGMVLKITKQAAKNKALKLMEEVGIPEPRKRYRDYPFQFSGGMRQRIVIAIALAANPDILICDEPTTALDVTIQAQILELINRLKRDRNLSIIFITHDLGVVANMADRIAVMYAGKIVEYGSSEEIFYEPAHPYTWALLSSMPDLDTKEKLEAIPGTPPDMIYPPKGDAFAQRNRYAMKIDFEKQPPAFPITETHWAATWLLHPNAPKVEPPKTVTDRIARMKARVGGEANV